MDIFICDSCGNEFNIENEGTVQCPQCGTHHTVTLRKKKEELADAPQDKPEEEEGFSLSRLRSNIMQSYEEELAQLPADKQPQEAVLPVAAAVDAAQEQTADKKKGNKKEKAAKEERPVSPEKQARLDKKAKKKQARLDKRQEKEDKRNAKISRQLNRNTNKLMFVVCIIMIALCAVLLFMYKNNLTFFDLPAVISGSNGSEKPTISVNINEQIPGIPAEPPIGTYTVVADAGVGIYSAANDQSEYLDAATKDTVLDIKAFKYDTEGAQYWGRIKTDDGYAWVPMNGLQQTTVSAATTANVIG